KWINPWMRAGFRQQIEMSDDFYRKIYRNEDIREQARHTIDMRQAKLEALPWWYSIISLLVLALLWFLWSTFTPGGFLLRTLGMELVRNDGRRAGFLQCAYRAALFWLPIVILLSISIALDGTYWQHWTDTSWRESERWRLWVSFFSWWLGVSL